MKTIQDLIHQLNTFWKTEGCLLHHGYDLEMGAGTFNPTTFLRCLGPEPYAAAYVEPSRRPTDGRYGENPNRVQHFHQYQVILKPSPPDIQTVYLRSLKAIGIDLSKHDIRFVHDDWESPTLGAWGLGWEVWLDGQEVTQITYFQCFGGIDVKPVTGEITYGIERLAMYLQNVNSIFDLKWNDNLTYRDLYHANEVQWSHYNFEQADIQMWLRHFEDDEREAKRLISIHLPLPAYDFVAKASHAFNILDARGAISVTERTRYIGRIRDLARLIAQAYIADREQKGFPLKDKFPQKNKKETLIENVSSLTCKNSTGTFLLEIGSEELPASFVANALISLEKKIRELLKKENIAHGSIHTYATARRLAICIQGLSATIPSSKIEKKGPPLESLYDQNGELTLLAEGFFKSIKMNAPSLKDLKNHQASGFEVRKIKETEYLFAVLLNPEQSSLQQLASHLPHLILSIDFPKKMRWADNTISYARPLLWISALYEDQILPFSVGEIASGRVSFGHRQLDDRTFELNHANTYVETLLKHHIMVDIPQRKKAILEGVHAIEKEWKAKAICVEEVMKEVLFLVEWPFVIGEPFDARFLEAPKELIASEMVEHQRYFPMEKADGALVNAFIIVCNNTPSEEIRRGNSNVLCARLSDGLFLYKKDLQSSLDGSFNAFNEKLKAMIYQEELGSIFDKMERIKKHMQIIGNQLKIPEAQQIQVLRAAQLCKSDLASHVVYEFPLLQGTMGKYYAKAAGETHAVALAIEEHWMPKGEHAPLPTSRIGAILSIADKMDTLIGCFATDRKPSSSSDPYALRRQVLGILRILIEHKMRLPLEAILTGCAHHFPPFMAAKAENVAKEIIAFIENRVRTVFVGFGFKHDEIEASLSFGFDDLYDSYLRIQALHQFRQNDPRFHGLYEVYKRAKGQLEGALKTRLNASLLIETPEIELYTCFNQISQDYANAMKEQQYDQAYELITILQAPLAKLFNEVKILAEDIELRNNRLALLQQIFGLCEGLLDFGKLQQKN